MIQIKRNRTTLSVLIVSVLVALFVGNIFNFWIDNLQLSNSVFVFNATLNRTVRVVVSNYTRCGHLDSRLRNSQDLVYGVIRVMMPFALMVASSVPLCAYIDRLRNRTVNHSNTTPSQRRENGFTLSACFINGVFLVLNTSYFVAVMVVSYYNLSGANASLGFRARVQLQSFQIFSELISYMFTVWHFWFDLAFNRAFRNEVVAFLLLVSGNGHRIESEMSAGANVTSLNARTAKNIIKRKNGIMT